MIKFIKILAYSLTPPDGEVFDYLAGVTNQSIDSSSLAPNGLEVNDGVVLCSSLRRAVECVKQEKDVVFVVLDSLREIRFDLSQICSKNNWEKERSVAVRRGFKRAFVEDKLPVSREVIFKEIKELLALIKNNYSGQQVTVVSHSFRLKLIEAYCLSDGAIEKDPNLINSYLLDDRKTYEFGQGFTVGE